MARSRSTFCLLLTVIVPVVLARVSFVGQHESVTFKEGASRAIIVCRVIELNTSTQVLSFERERQVISDDTVVRRETLESSGQDSARYKVRLIIHEEDQTRFYSLSVESPTRNDTSRFRCVVCGKNASTSACDANDILATSNEVALTINYPPADPYPICAGPGSPTAAPTASFVLVVEGKPAEFFCSSETASPPIQLTWTTNGTEVKNGVGVSDKAGIRTSTLTITPAKADNGTVLTCTLTSDAYNESERSCSAPPLNVAPGPADIMNTTSMIVIIVLAVIVALLLVAIVVASFMKRKKKNHESRGHKIEYQPAGTKDGDTEDEVNLRANRDLQ